MKNPGMPVVRRPGLRSDVDNLSHKPTLSAPQIKSPPPTVERKLFGRTPFIGRRA